MGFTDSGLVNGGRTTHFHVTYDTTFSTADGRDRTNQFLAVCEQDYALMKQWFGGISDADAPLSVQIVNKNNGASWNNSNIAIDAPPGSPVSFIRYLLVSEVVEQFMASQNAGWFQNHDEGSKGEGLSLFLAVQFRIAIGLPPVPPSGFGVIRSWLNGARGNFIDTAPDDFHHDQTTGCTTGFIYFLHDQLGFGIEAIIAAAGSTLAKVYTHLTGKTDAWSAFSGLVHDHYPPGIDYHPAGDNLFPVSTLSQFPPTNEITCGYQETTLIVVDKPAMAEVVVHLKSDDPTIASVPATVTIPVGGTSAAVTVSTTAIAGPFAPKKVNVHATYAGKTLTMTVSVAPPRVVSVALAPTAVLAGDFTTATVTLNRPSLLGDVLVDLTTSEPAFATVPSQVTIPQNHSSVQFTVNTPAWAIPIKTSYAKIYASYADSTAYALLTIKSHIVAGVLSSLSLLPNTVNAGGTSHGLVELVEAVPTPTVVSLAVADLGAAPQVPVPVNPSSVASVPAELTIPPGHQQAEFTITTNHNVLAHTQKRATITAFAVVSKAATLTIDG